MENTEIKVSCHKDNEIVMTMEQQVTPLNTIQIKATITMTEAQDLIEGLKVAILRARGFRSAPKQKIRWA